MGFALRLNRLRALAPTLSACAGVCLSPASLGAPPVTAQTLVERGVLAMRIDPEASRRDAEAAIVMLARDPNADLEIRARILLCDYQAERDKTAAEREIAKAIALMPDAQRQGLRAGVLTCEGDLNETAGDNTQAITLYEQAVAVGTETQGRRDARRRAVLARLPAGRAG